MVARRNVNPYLFFFLLNTDWLPLCAGGFRTYIKRTLFTFRLFLKRDFRPCFLFPHQRTNQCVASVRDAHLLKLPLLWQYYNFDALLLSETLKAESFEPKLRDSVILFVFLLPLQNAPSCHTGPSLVCRAVMSVPSRFLENWILAHGDMSSARNVESRATTMHSKHIQVLYPVYCSQTWCMKRVRLLVRGNASEKIIFAVCTFSRALNSTLQGNIIWDGLVNDPSIVA